MLSFIYFSHATEITSAVKKTTLNSYLKIKFFSNMPHTFYMCTMRMCVNHMLLKLTGGPNFTLPTQSSSFTGSVFESSIYN